MIKRELPNLTLPTKLLLIFLSVIILGYLFPSSSLSAFISYFNEHAALFLVILTFSYVLTTNRQLQSMEKQLNVMDSSVKLQIQPLPVPEVSEIYLEKIRPYLAPETEFKKVELLSRLHYKIKLKNIGNGAALNIVMFSMIHIEGKLSKEIYLPTFHPEQIHLVSENKTEVGYFMQFDKDFDLLKGLNSEGSVTLNIEIYYRNIFGAGFKETSEYYLRVDSKQLERLDEWSSFIESDNEELQKDIKRFESLTSTLPEEADHELEKIKSSLDKKFTEDLKLKCRNNPRPFKVEIVDYAKAIDDAKKTHDSKVDDYFPNMRGGK
jgi:hypothetical protein